MSNPWDNAPIVGITPAANAQQISAAMPWSSAPIVQNNNSSGYSDAGAINTTQPTKNGASKVPSAFPTEFDDIAPSNSKNNLNYAWDVLQTPSRAGEKYLSKLTHAIGIDNDYQYNTIQNQIKQFSQQKAIDRSKAYIPFVTDLVANPLTYALPTAGVGASLMGKVGLGALAGAAYSTLDPDATPGSVALGTVAGGAVPIATGAIGNGISKVADWTSGHLPDAVQKLQSLGKRYGVNLTAGMLQPGLGTTEERVGMVPFAGMNQVYNDTQAQTQTAVQHLLAEAQEKAGITGTSGTADDLARASFQAQHSIDTAIGHGKYDNVSNLAGNAALPTTTLEQELQAQKLANLQSLNPDIALDNKYATELTRLQQAQPGGMTAHPITGAPIPVADNSYDGVHKMASDYWKKAQAFDIGTPEYSNNMAISNAARQDMNNFASNSSNPALQDASADANDWWKTRVKRYSPDSADSTEATWAKQIRGSDVNPQKPMDFFIQPGQYGRAKYYYDGLTETGRDAVRFGIVDDAYSKATTMNPQGSPVFNPGRFASELTKNDAGVSTFFQGDQKENIDSLAKVLTAAKNTVLSNGNIRTGWTGATIGSSMTSAGAIGSGLTATALGNPAVGVPLIAGAAVPSVFSRYVLRPLFTTDAGKRLLLNVDGMSAGSKALMNTVENQLPKVVASGIAAKNQISSKDEYDALPSGSPYTASDGSEGIKP
jgi:hypothetical protein